MQFFKYSCENDHVFRKWRKTKNRNKKALCEECGAVAHRDKMAELEKKSAHVFEPYVDHNLAPEPVKVKSKSQKEKLKDEAGVREKGSYVE